MPTFAADVLNDLYRLDVTNSSAPTWNSLSYAYSPPSARSGVGFTAAPLGNIYLFGGMTSTNGG